MQVWVSATAALAMIGGAAMADPVGGDTARKMLFSAKGYAASLPPESGLSATERKTVEYMIDKVPQFADVAGYYGAIAFSPGDGLASEALTMSKNLHTPQDAAAAALKICNAKKSAAEPCRIAAYILPKNWSEQPVMLSVAATKDFGSYRRGKGPKAMAISAATGVYSIAKGPNADRAAMNDCLAKAQPMGAQDCAVVIADN